MFFLQAEDGIRDLVRSRGRGDVYKRQHQALIGARMDPLLDLKKQLFADRTIATYQSPNSTRHMLNDCLLYTSDAADERSSVDLGGRRIIKKKKK